MRELVRSVSKNKPLIAVAERETEHGGLTEDEARVQCVTSGSRFDGWGFSANVPPAATLADALLGPAHGSAAYAARSGAACVADEGKPIVYERVGAFQQTMLRLIVQRLAPQREMYLPGELAPRKQPLSPPAGEFHVWCSRYNPGVRTLIDEVCVRTRPAQGPRPRVLASLALTLCASPNCPQMKRFGWGDELLVTDDPDQMEQADHVLLYLNRSTWANDDRRETLVAEVLVPLQRKPRRPLLLVHETDETDNQLDGVAKFAYFFGDGVTPSELMKHGIYTEIAIPMKTGAYRSVSRGLLDCALRAEFRNGAGRDFLRRFAATYRRLPSAPRLKLQASSRGLAKHAAVTPIPRDSKLNVGQANSGNWDILRKAKLKVGATSGQSWRPIAPPGATTYKPSSGGVPDPSLTSGPSRKSSHGSVGNLQRRASLGKAPNPTSSSTEKHETALLCEGNDEHAGATDAFASRITILPASQRGGDEHAGAGTFSLDPMLPAPTSISSSGGGGLREFNEEGISSSGEGFAGAVPSGPAGARGGVNFGCGLSMAEVAAMWEAHHATPREEALPPLGVWLEAVGLTRCAGHLAGFGFTSLSDVWEMTFDDASLIGLSTEDTRLVLEALVTRGPGSGNVAGLEEVAEKRRLVNEAWRVKHDSPKPPPERRGSKQRRRSSVDMAIRAVATPKIAAKLLSKANSAKKSIKAKQMSSKI